MLRGLKCSEPVARVQNVDILQAVDTRGRVMSFEAHDPAFRFMGEDRIFESIIMSESATSFE